MGSTRIYIYIYIYLTVKHSESNIYLRVESKQGLNLDSKRIKKNEKNIKIRFLL